jgi:hypothetical protein
VQRQAGAAKEKAAWAAQAAFAKKVRRYGCNNIPTHYA